MPVHSIDLQRIPFACVRISTVNIPASRSASWGNASGVRRATAALLQWVLALLLVPHWTYWNVGQRVLSGSTDGKNWTPHRSFVLTVNPGPGSSADRGAI